MRRGCDGMSHICLAYVVEGVSWICQTGGGLAVDEWRFLVIKFALMRRAAGRIVAWIGLTEAVSVRPRRSLPVPERGSGGGGTIYSSFAIYPEQIAKKTSSTCQVLICGAQSTTKCDCDSDRRNKLRRQQRGFTIVAHDSSRFHILTSVGAPLRGDGRTRTRRASRAQHNGLAIEGPASRCQGKRTAQPWAQSMFLDKSCQSASAPEMEFIQAHSQQRHRIPRRSQDRPVTQATYLHPHSGPSSTTSPKR
ncbi:hypothetical protein QBC34DRAFT_196631 [Podospora aff. communis PSN243]|uniref:Uncharacterized protein n=1 Tax=Podospora aff. communis PSN243 TaxID=3040156 RepID=A0AAV9G6M5_9PEZI|nr:hypothetical protein QBC34DRAFT_196631 [Podospora aff. communis PSN243]